MGNTSPLPNTHIPQFTLKFQCVKKAISSESASLQFLNLQRISGIFAENQRPCPITVFSRRGPSYDLNNSMLVNYNIWNVPNDKFSVRKLSYSERLETRKRVGEITLRYMFVSSRGVTVG
jgi:hypothetical protein